MKNKILMLTAIAAFAFSGNAIAQKSGAEIRLAKADSVEDYNAFRKKAESDIADNERKIAKLKERKADESKEVKEKYNQRIAALEERNNKLKVKMKDSETTKTSMWSSFKREFKHDADEIAKAIKDIGVDNAK